jgi:hypothetical protein
LPTPPVTRLQLIAIKIQGRSTKTHTLIPLLI